MENNKIWEELYSHAKSLQNPRTISPFIEAGGVIEDLQLEKTYGITSILTFVINQKHFKILYGND